MLELVDSLSLSLSDASRKRSNRFSDRGYSLTGKTAILHIVILGSSPDNSIAVYYLIKILFSPRERARCTRARSPRLLL